jgi:CubicO group peptidase (beta-lactamase class C family)
MEKNSLLVVLSFLLVLLMGCIAKPAYLRLPVLDKQVVDVKAEAFLQRMMLEEHFTGVALVMNKGNVIHAKGYGKAKDDKEDEVTTLFHVASITKQFTAAAVMQLVEKGKLSLEGSINNYLPIKYRSPKWSSPSTA